MKSRLRGNKPFYIMHLCCSKHCANLGMRVPFSSCAFNDTQTNPGSKYVRGRLGTLQQCRAPLEAARAPFIDVVHPLKAA